MEVFGGEYYAIRGALVAMSGVHATPCATADACREWVAHDGGQTYTRFLSPGIDKDLLMELQGDALVRIAHYSSLNGGLSGMRMSLDADGDVQIAAPRTTVPCRLRSEDMEIRRDGDALVLVYTLSEGGHEDENDCEASHATRVELHCVSRYVARLEPLSAATDQQTSATAPEPAETRVDAAAIDLEIVAAGDLSHFTPAESRTLAQRAHEAVLALEAQPTHTNRPERWRLHALAGELVEYLVGNPTPPYFGEVRGLVVNLHDLRSAQLLREDPTLLSVHLTPSVELRRETIRWLLDAPADPASVDAEVVLGLMRASVPP